MLEVKCVHQFALSYASFSSSALIQTFERIQYRQTISILSNGAKYLDISLDSAAFFYSYTTHPKLTIRCSIKLRNGQLEESHRCRITAKE